MGWNPPSRPSFVFIITVIIIVVVVLVILFDNLFYLSLASVPLPLAHPRNGSRQSRCLRE